MLPAFMLAFMPEQTSQTQTGVQAFFAAEWKDAARRVMLARENADGRALERFLLAAWQVRSDQRLRTISRPQDCIGQPRPAMTDTTQEQMEPDSTVYKTLLESTKAIPWKIDWSSMQFAYIGPQIEQLLGWSPESWKTADDWAMRIHAEDREAVVNFCISQSKAGADHEADYRALTRDGEHVWIRDVVHVVRNDDGSPNALIGFMFDITERKKTEARLIELQKELEALSYRDGLTDVANRRMFDSALEVEWANAVSTRAPLSLIMLDIDYFKQYNDQYGHIRGDECLKQVARILSQTATRSRDFFARYGGEEFVLILPECDEKAALQVAQRCRNLILDAAIPHASSQVAEMVTISQGVATIVPSPMDQRIEFLELADRRLYRAKQLGRNCIAVDE